MEFGRNIHASVKEVRHADLKRIGDSMYRSECPECKDGTLPVYRDQNSFQLQELDRCVSCGQAFRYLDIEEMRAKDWAGHRRAE